MWDALIPIGVMFGTNLLNLLYLGPATTKVMKERKHQGEAATQDGFQTSCETRAVLITNHRDTRRQEVLRPRT